VDVTYLVTGATGHLGNVIVRKLAAQGNSVRALVLPNDPLAEELPDEVQIFSGDISQIDSLRPFFTVEGKEAIVIHSAGIVSIASKDDQRMKDINVGGIKNILRLCREFKVSKLVYVSSVHAIPELPKGEVIKEIHDFDAQKIIGPYAKTKAEATALVLEAASLGLDASVVHPSGIVGPFDYGRGHMTQLIIDYCQGRLVAGVKGGYDFVDVRDVADGVIACCHRGKKGECYILSNRYFSIQEVFDLLQEVTGKEKPKAVLPMWFARLTAPLSELYYKLLKQPPLYTPYSLYTLSSNAVFSHAKAGNELGYSVRPFGETIGDTVEWLRVQRRI